MIYLTVYLQRMTFFECPVYNYTFCLAFNFAPDGPFDIMILLGTEL